MKKLSILFLLYFSISTFGQFTSPGTGIKYTLESLSAAAPTVLVKNTADYTMTADITISQNDSLVITQNAVLKMNANVTLGVAGVFSATAPNFLITASVPTAAYKGLRFDASSKVTIKNTKIELGGGIRASTGDFLMDNCIMEKNVAGISTSAAITFSTGKPIVQNSQFLQNDYPAFGSGANQTVAATFYNNYLYGNSKLNTNRPQINMGPSGNDTIKIIKNTIIGDRTLTRVGGVSASSLLGIANKVMIDQNIIKDNRYGITVVGNVSGGYIRKNIIENNNTEPTPANGGSGISLSGSSADVMNIFISENQIRNNLWGITFVTKAQANLGSDAAGSINIGKNIFYNNGNGGLIYALYNNTPNAIQAKFNCWRENELSTNAMVEEVITHQTDNATLGLVDFSSYLCNLPLSTSEVGLLKNKIYPNPSIGEFIFETQDTGNIIITDATGRFIYSGFVEKGKNTIKVNAEKGVYFITHHSSGKKSTSKLIVE